MGGQDLGFFNTGNDTVDLKVEMGDLAADNGLETAVLISLFTDRFVPLEELPEGETDRRGWWGDHLSEIEGDRIGSKLWTLDRGKLNLETRNRLKDYAAEALAWMIDEGVASDVVTQATLIRGQRIDLEIEIYRPDGDQIPFKFLWDGQELKRG